MSHLKSIGVIVPVFNESVNLRKFVERLESVTTSMSNYNWHYIFVNDGSQDNSWAILHELSLKYQKIIALDLSRNFGKEIALTAGVHETAVDIDAVICMDADLQHPPELIPQLITAWEQGAEIVITCRQSIQEQPLLRRLGSYVFYWFMNKISDIKMLPQTTDYRLFDKKVIFFFKQIKEQKRMFRGLLDWMGFRSTIVNFHADARQGGEAGYSYSKLIRLSLDAFTSFSLFPLRLISYLGIVVSLVSSILLSIMLIIRFFINAKLFTGLAFLAVGNTLLMGIILVGVGLVAMYVGKIHIEVLGRPLYIIRERL